MSHHPQIPARTARRALQLVVQTRTRTLLGGWVLGFVLLAAMGGASGGVGLALSAFVPWTVLGGAVLLPRLGLRPSVVAVLLAAFVLYSLYLTYTSFVERAFDGPSHLHYIRHIAEQLALPERGACAVCHHPPLYHLLAATLYRGCVAAGVGALTVGLQLLSLALMMVFAVFAALLLERLPASGGQRTLATALVVFWPSSVLHSVRVSNDLLVYPLQAAALYFAVRWWDEQRRWQLAAACIATALGVLTKATAHALVIVLLGMVLVRVVRRAHRWAALGRVAPAVGALLLVVALNAVCSRDGCGLGAAHNVLGGAYKTDPHELLDDGPTAYTHFGVQDFVRWPFFDMGGPRRTDSYWGQLMRSSLWGSRVLTRRLERDFEPSKPIAQGANFAALFVVLSAAAALLTSRRHWLRPYGVYLWAAFVFLAMGLGFRALAPTLPHGDFRFVYPVLIPAAALFAGSLQTLRRRGLAIEAAPWIAAIALVALTVAYYWPQSIQPLPAGAPPAPAGAASSSPDGRPASKPRLIDKHGLWKIRRKVPR